MTASKINPTGLTVPNALHATGATTAGSATNASSLGGIPASGYTRNDCNSRTGQINGWALVSASPSFPSTFTTNGVSSYSCSGGVVEARRTTTGEYEVKFVNNPAVIAVGSVNGAGPVDDSVSFNTPAGGDFVTTVFNNPSGTSVDAPFDMILP